MAPPINTSAIVITEGPRTTLRNLRSRTVLHLVARLATLKARSLRLRALRNCMLHRAALDPKATQLWRPQTTPQPPSTLRDPHSGRRRRHPSPAYRLLRRHSDSIGSLLLAYLRQQLRALHLAHLLLATTATQPSYSSTTTTRPVQAWGCYKLHMSIVASMVLSPVPAN
jgi:hypothetical protein